MPNLESSAVWWAGMPTPIRLALKSTLWDLVLFAVCFGGGVYLYISSCVVMW